MRRRLPLFLTLVAWLFATGSHWEVAQTLAGSHMLAVNSTKMTFVRAVKKTFSPEGRCEFCTSIAHAREQREQSSAGKSVLGGKIPSDLLLITSPTDKLFFPPALLRCGVFPQKDLLASVERTLPWACCA
jgi:hypothetical protein